MPGGILAEKLKRQRKRSRRPLSTIKHRAAGAGRRLGSFESLEPRRLLSLGFIDLGPSDNIAIDQPRVAVELLESTGPGPDDWGSVGPSMFNTFLLDTGANSILAMATAVADMAQPPYPYQTQGTFVEQGVAGDHLMDISVPYRFDFAGTSGIRNTLPVARIQSDANNDFSMFGPWGLAGMPAMVNRVTSLDMSVWSQSSTQPDLFMHTDFSDTLPADNGHRYSVALDNRLAFDPLPQTTSGDPPIWADIPFLTAVPTHNGVGQPANFLLDTGAQLSVISESLAFDLGLDTDGDGNFTNEAVRFETVGGVGGTVTAPVLAIDEVRVPTTEGVDLVWTDLQWLVLDIAVPGEVTTLDGVFGSDLLTSGWAEAFFNGGPDGYFQQVRFDFRDMETLGQGTLNLDLTPAHDNVTPPGPGMRVLESLGYTEVIEGGPDDFYRIVLTEQPTANVTVQMGVPPGQVTATDEANPANSFLTFTPQNWNVPQTVVVKAADNGVAEVPHWVTITHTISSADPGYQGLTGPDVDVKVLDNDTSLLVIEQTGGSTDVSEAGGQDTYTVRLAQATTSEIWVQFDDPAGQVQVVNQAKPDPTDPYHNIFVFNSSNWNQPQTVVVTAVDDTIVEGPHQAHVVHEVNDANNLVNPLLGKTVLTVNVEDNDVAVTQVAGRHIFYNDTSYDGHTPGADAQDDGAIDPGKTALLPGQTATAANFITFGRYDAATGLTSGGVTGIMVDVTGLANPAGIDAADFAFAYGNDNTPSGWTSIAAAEIAVRKGAGVGGSDRITLIWAEDAIPARNWLQVTVKATADTGLAADDVFYFGAAIGDADENFVVDFNDVFAIHQSAFQSASDISDPLDIDRNAVVDYNDLFVAYEHAFQLPSLAPLAPPAAAAVFAAAAVATSEQLPATKFDVFGHDSLIASAYRPLGADVSYHDGGANPRHFSWKHGLLQKPPQGVPWSTDYPKLWSLLPEITPGNFDPVGPTNAPEAARLHDTILGDELALRTAGGDWSQNHDERELLYRVMAFDAARSFHSTGSGDGSRHHGADTAVQRAFDLALMDRWE